MNTPASVRNHPIHPMLIVFPIGLWVFSLVCDVIYHAGSNNTFWKAVAFYTMAGGIAGALLAAIPGFIDYSSLTDPRVKKIATTHMVVNIVVVALFLFNLGFRYNAAPEGEVVAVALSVIGIVLMSVSGWLGGSLVVEHHVGVSVTREEEREIRRRAA
jgi:uncharacterized membrane protein